MTTIKDCPKCGAEDALETFLRIDLDDVVVRDGALVEFTLAGSADNATNGIVVEEATISCRECGHEIDGIVPYGISDCWTFQDDWSDPVTKRRADAHRLCELLRDGVPVMEAIGRVGLDPDELHSEDSSVFSLDDRDNDIIDFGWLHGECVIVRRSGMHHNERVRLQELEVAFEQAGGRGVELAEEIDELRTRAHDWSVEFRRSGRRQ